MAFCVETKLNDVETAHEEYLNEIKSKPKSADILFYKYFNILQQQETLSNINYNKLLIENESLLSPQMIDWLLYLKKNNNIVTDNYLNRRIEDVIENISILENIIHESPKFVAQKDVIKALDYNIFLYTTNSLINKPLFNSDTGKLDSEHWTSYELFVNQNVDSAYYKDIINFYNLIKANKYRENAQINNYKIKSKYLENSKHIVAKNISHTLANLLNDEAIRDEGMHWNMVQDIRTKGLEDAKAEEWNKAKLKKEHELLVKKNQEQCQLYFGQSEKLYKKLYNDYNLNDIDKNPDFIKIDTGYKAYLNNKNNMQANFSLFRTIVQYKQEYKKMFQDINYEYEQAYEKMVSENNYTDGSYDTFKDTSELYGFRTLSSLNNMIDFFQVIGDEIYQYSWDYEEQKVANYIKTHGRKKICGSISNFAYLPTAGIPQKGCLYSYSTLKMDFPLIVFQVLPNGILVTGDYSLGYASTMKYIFLTTNKKYVSKQLLKGYGLYEYVGIKHYKTVLGTQNAVWQFRQYSDAEIKKYYDIGNKLYFYKSAY